MNVSFIFRCILCRRETSPAIASVNDHSAAAAHIAAHIAGTAHIAADHIAGARTQRDYDHILQDAVWEWRDYDRMAATEALHRMGHVDVQQHRYMTVAMGIGLDMPNRIDPTVYRPIISIPVPLSASSYGQATPEISPVAASPEPESSDDSDGDMTAAASIRRGTSSLSAISPESSTITLPSSPVMYATWSFSNMNRTQEIVDSMEQALAIQIPDDIPFIDLDFL